MAAGAKRARTKRTRPRAAGRRKAGAASPVRPALGNDPFARGAALREVLPPAPRAAPPSTPGPAAPPAEPVATVERKVEAALEGVEERLVDLAERAGIQEAGRELRGMLQGLLPRLRAALGSAFQLLRLLEPSEGRDPFGLDARFAERFAPIADLLYASWWRVGVHDAAHVPASGPAIVVANHAGLVPWDALVLREALRRDHPAHRSLRPLLDDRECALPLVGGVFTRLGAVRANPAAAAALLRAGELVGVFPEGSAGARKPWRERYRLQRFGRGGVVKLALRTGAPLVPCAIIGSEEASPAISRSGWLAERLGVPLIGKGAALRFGPAALIPLPSRWSFRFGAPLAMDGHGPADAEDETVVAELTERLRDAVQDMLDAELGGRGSVFI
jgi:1-acyl-sn-glycerol-3-phosphate acyltransferase